MIVSVVPAGLLPARLNIGNSYAKTPKNAL